jgi:DNA recombination protein RmuC
MRAFKADMLKHIADIAEKYIVPGETAEQALLFLPSEAVYAELHANFGEVVEQSYRKRVFIVSPTTLWATLNTIRAVLKDVRMRELAGEVQKEVHVLLEDIRRLGERVGRLQTHFMQANEDIHQIGVSSDKVTKRAARIEALEFDESGAALPLADAARPALPGSAGPSEGGGG